MSGVDVQASWNMPPGTSSARVVDPKPYETAGRTYPAPPRYIALEVGPPGRCSLLINFEDVAAAEQLVEVLTKAIAEKRERDAADAAAADAVSA